MQSEIRAFTRPRQSNVSAKNTKKKLLYGTTSYSFCPFVSQKRMTDNQCGGDDVPYRDSEIAVWERSIGLLPSKLIFSPVSKFANGIVRYDHRSSVRNRGVEMNLHCAFRFFRHIHCCGFRLETALARKHSDCECLRSCCFFYCTPAYVRQLRVCWFFYVSRLPSSPSWYGTWIFF